MGKERLILALSAFLLINAALFAQIEVINTGTSTFIRQVSKNQDCIFVNGQNDYLVKSYNELDSLMPLTVPGPIGYDNDYLNVIDTNNLFIVSLDALINYKVYHSSDGGYNWDLKLDTSGFTISHLIFFDSLEGIAISTFYNQIRTQDGGNTWTQEASPHIITTRLATWGDSTICVGVSEGFGISHDRGRTWTGNGFIQSSPRGFFFLNKDTIFATTYGGFGNFFMYSFDTGDTWQDNSIPIVNPYGVYFKGINEGYVVGSNSSNEGIILKTTDNGQSWSELNTQITTILIDITFINDSIAVINGTGGVLLKLNTNTATFTTSSSENITPHFNVAIHPNPTTGLITVTGLPKETTRITVYNVMGELVYDQELTGSNEPSVDLSVLPGGLYMIQLQNRQMAIRKKIIKL